MNTPAFTTATACNSALTGVGATMAAGNQRCRHQRRLADTKGKQAEQQWHIGGIYFASQNTASGKINVPVTPKR